MKMTFTCELHMAWYMSQAHHLTRARRPAGLMQGLPDGSEEARLQELEAELDRQAAALKQVKAQNRQARATQQPCSAIRGPVSNPGCVLHMPLGRASSS